MMKSKICRGINIPVAIYNYYFLNYCNYNNCILNNQNLSTIFFAYFMQGKQGAKKNQSLLVRFSESVSCGEEELTASDVNP